MQERNSLSQNALNWIEILLFILTSPKKKYSNCQIADCQAADYHTLNEDIFIFSGKKGKTFFKKIKIMGVK